MSNDDQGIDWASIYALLRLDRELWDIAPPPGWSVAEQRFILPGERPLRDQPD